MTFFNKWFFLAMLFAIKNVFSQDGQIENKETAAIFDGFYLGANMGIQNIFGGAFINDLDLLTQKSGFVFEFSPGYRFQFFEDLFIIGAELHLGFTDGDLEGYNSRNDLDVFYKNSLQSGFGLIAGVIIGSNNNYLIYVYTNETRRAFDIKLTESNGTVYEQEDVQNFLRYGLGLETPLINKFNIRASIGMVNVDYGDLNTSQDVEDKIDVNIGIVYQL